jgi:hypothetical protein
MANLLATHTYSLQDPALIKVTIDEYDDGSRVVRSGTADGSNVVLGATTDPAVTTNTTGTISGKLRGLVAILADVWDSVNHLIKVQQAALTAANDSVNLGTIGGAAGSTAGQIDVAASERQLGFATSGHTQAFGFAMVITSGSAYAAGNTIGGRVIVTTAVRVTNGYARLKSVLVRDSDKQKPELDIYIFNADPTATTTTDKTASLSINAADLSKLVRKIRVRTADYDDISNLSVADVAVSDEPVNSNGGTSLFYVAVVHSGTPQWTGTGNLNIRLGLVQD